MKKLLIILLLIVGCEPVTDILGVLSIRGYNCSIYGYAKKSTMIDENSYYDDSLTVLVSTSINGDDINNATNNCENNYGSIERDYLMKDSLGIFDSCYCVQ